MNIIETVKDVVSQFPKINEICNGIHIDSTEDRPDDYGLSPIGDMLVREDVQGNQLRQHNFSLLAVWPSQSDYERMINSGTLLEMHYWLENQKYNQTVTATFGEKTVTGRLLRMTCSNGMLYDITEGNLNGKVIYQIQIAAQYEIESEELF